MSAPTIDFLRPGRLGALAWALLAGGVAALAVAVVLQRQWAHERATLQAAADARTETLERQRREAARPVPITPDERRLQQVAPQLRQPWLPALRVIEGVTKAPVFLLALSIDPASGAVRLEGEAPSFEQALDYARALGEGDALGAAELRSHELHADPGGRTTVRFTVVARWNAR
jgi:hypothetical protein